MWQYSKNKTRKEIILDNWIQQVKIIKWAFTSWLAAENSSAANLLNRRWDRHQQLKLDFSKLCTVEELASTTWVKYQTKECQFHLHHAAYNRVTSLKSRRQNMLIWYHDQIIHTWNLLNAIRRSNSWSRMSSSLCVICQIFPSWALDVVSHPSGLFLNSVPGILVLFKSSPGESNILHLFNQRSIVKVSNLQTFMTKELDIGKNLNNIKKIWA